MPPRRRPVLPDANVTIPYRYQPREYQRGVWDAFNAGFKRGVLVWPRRAGKDTTSLNLLITRALDRVGVYYYFFPEFNQGRRILWEGIDHDGFRMREYFHESIVARRKDGTPDFDEQEMRVRLVNGSIAQIVGTDDFDKVRGTNPVGCIFSEYSYQNPAAWRVVSPILAANGGWALFIFTPNGKNHAFKLYRRGLANSEWFVQRLTVRDTHHIDDAVIASEREEHGEEFVEQEYYCSFEIGSSGSYYGRLLNKAYDEERVTRVPWEPTLKVITAWDLGMDDQTAIWFVQLAGREIRWIDYYENSGEGLAHYAAVLEQRGYRYQEHLLPHDANVRELGTGKSRVEIAQSFGIRPIRVIQRSDPEDGVEAVRRILSASYFDATRCERGLEALSAYSKDWDPKRETWKKQARHDWASHAADAARTFAEGFRAVQDAPRPLKAETEYDVLNTRSAPQTGMYPPWMRSMRRLQTEAAR